MSGSVREAQLVVFDVSGRLREIQFVVFYVSGIRFLPVQSFLRIRILRYFWSKVVKKLVFFRLSEPVGSESVKNISSLLTFVQK